MPEMNSSSSPSSKLICLWTVPRACSTAFERSVMNRTDMEEVFHEPLSIPYYFGPKDQRGSMRYADAGERETYREKLEEMKRSRDKATDGNHVFSKDMAYYLTGPDGEIDQERLQQVVDDFDVHTFLIKNPARQVQSLYRMSTEQTEATGWSTFDPKEVGYKEMKLLMNAVREKHGGKDVVIVDADELIANPNAVLKSYCDAIGLPFEQDRMLQWEAHDEAITKKWADWQGWHDHALQSTGFEKPKNGANGKRKPPLSEQAKQVVDKAIATSMPIYEEMYKVRLKTATAY